MKLKLPAWMKKPFHFWLVIILLSAVSFEGILSFPGILSSSQTLMQYIVICIHALYVIAGIGIIIGMWRYLRFTSFMVIIWGIASLGAAIGGPLALSQVQPTFTRTAVIMGLLIALLTSGLFLYTRRICK